MDNKLITKSYKLREDTVAIIKDMAEAYDASESSIVRFILTEFFKEDKPQGVGFYK